ncbi:MAG: ABC transporter permease [Nitrospinota bacterium]
MRIFRYILFRLLILIPLLLGIFTVVFLIIHVLPGDPVQLIAGSMASKETIQSITERLNLDKPLSTQYWMYLKGLFRLDLGTSWFTGNPVTQDIMLRFPATLELITLSLLVTIVVSIPLGVLVAMRPRGIPGRLIGRSGFYYGMLAGSLPDFWFGLIFIFVFYYKLQLFPAPFGRIDPAIAPPAQVTGIYVLDSLFTGNWAALRSAFYYLALPVGTLSLVYSPILVKVVYSAMNANREGSFVRFAQACGLSRLRTMAYAFQNSLPPVITIVAIIYGYLLGGAVLVETIFSWSGIGQYAVQSIVYMDFAAIQGFVIVAAVFSVLVYLAVDILYLLVDPRIEF